MLGKPHVFVVHGFLGRGVWKCESRSCVLPIHEESGCFAGCVSCGTKDGRRQITHHDSSVVTSDDSPGISRKGYTAKIHTGIDERQEGGSIIVCNGPAADKCLGVSIDADRCAGRIGAAAVILNLICAEKPCLAVAVEVDASNCGKRCLLVNNLPFYSVTMTVSTETR